MCGHAKCLARPSQRHNSVSVHLQRDILHPAEIKPGNPPMVVVVVVLTLTHINSHNQVRGHRTGSSHSGCII